jgi:hypothetical protein
LLQSSVMIVAGIVSLYTLQLRFSDVMAMPAQDRELAAPTESGSP